MVRPCQSGHRRGGSAASRENADFASLEAFVPFVAVPLVIAHRGASAEAPENTLAAFRRALALKVDGVELDVHVTLDGVPVVFHDMTLRRLTGVSGRIGTKTWRELRMLRVRGEPIPRLADVLALVRGRAVMQIEIKPGTPVFPVIRVLRRAPNSTRMILASFEPSILLATRRLAPDLPRMLISNGRRRVSDFLRQLAALEARGLSIDHRAVSSADWVGRFHARGYQVWCWTVNDVRSQRRLAARGVDAILSDNPASLKKTLNNRGSR